MRFTKDKYTDIASSEGFRGGGRGEGGDWKGPREEERPGRRHSFKVVVVRYLDRQ